MNGLEDIPTNTIFLGRTEMHSPLTGKLVRIHDSETYEDVFGIHLGCFQNTRWDREREFIFHTILGCDGVVHNYCLRKSEKPERIMKVIA